MELDTVRKNMSAELLVKQGAQPGLVFRVEKDETRIGRVGCDISLADHLVSRVHACILRKGAGYEIEDQGSRNGLFVNEARILRALLSDGDLITIGNTVLQFRCARAPRDKGAESAGQSRPVATHTIAINAREHLVFTEDVDEKDIESLRRAKADLETIYRANQFINKVMDPGQLISRVLEFILAEIPGVDTCSLHLLREDTGELVCRQQCRRDAADATATPAFSTSLINMVLQERKALLTYDAQQDEKLKAQASIVALHIRSAMCVPLQSRDHLLGILQASATHVSHRLDREDLKLLAALGFQAGIALENALLYEKLTIEKAALSQAHESLKAAQAVLVRSEKLAAVGRLTAGLVHDVKNPMTVILTYAELLEKHLAANGLAKVGDMDVCASLVAIQEGVLHCNEIINRLLQFARQAAPAKTPLSLNDLVDSTAAFLAHEFAKARARLEQNLAPDLPEVMADPGQVRQVLLNLLINALQALGAGGGHIVIITAKEQSNGKTFVVCRVRDDGTGMTADVKQRLFEPFFSTKAKDAGLGGNGLGLSVSYGIIQNHGGTIEVESEPGKGSTFSIKLPVNNAKENGKDAGA